MSHNRHYVKLSEVARRLNSLSAYFSPLPSKAPRLSSGALRACVRATAALLLLLTLSWPGTGHALGVNLPQVKWEPYSVAAPAGASSPGSSQPENANVANARHTNPVEGAFITAPPVLFG